MRDGSIVEAERLSDKQLSVLTPLRADILEELAENPSYPAEIAEKLGCDRQKIYYHFRKMEDAGLVEKDSSSQISGGEATYYRPSEDAYVLDLDGDSEEFPVPESNSDAVSFLRPLVREKEMNGHVVAGSPDQHGPDQVRARDGHLASEIAFKLGNYSRRNSDVVLLDTEIVKKELFDRSLLLLGGVLTNVVAKEFNESFPAYFPSDKFPYRELRTPENSYGSGEIGVVAKTPNPQNRSESLFLVAGVQSKGTRAAVKAFSDLEQLVEGYEGGRFYAVVKGLDLNSDGEIDEYRVMEKNV